MPNLSGHIEGLPDMPISVDLLLSFPSAKVHKHLQAMMCTGTIQRSLRSVPAWHFWMRKLPLVSCVVDSSLMILPVCAGQEVRDGGGEQGGQG